MSNGRYSNTSTAVACTRSPLQPSSIRVTLQSIVPVATSSSTNVLVSRQVAYSNSQSVISSSILSSLRPPTAVISGQLLPLPTEISSKLDLLRPVSIKIGSRRILLDAENFVKTSSGVSIAMPPHWLEQVINPANTASVQKGSPQALPNNNHTATGVSEGKVTIDLDDLPAGDASLIDLVSISSSISESSICSIADQKQLLVIERHTPFRKLNAGVESMQRIFSYLGVIDLLQVSRVCRVWRNLAAQQHLVRLGSCSAV